MEQFDINAIEARILAAGKQVMPFVRQLGIPESTWRTWRKGKVQPSYSRGVEVLAAVRELEE